MSLISSQRAHKTRDRDRPLISDSTRKQTKHKGSRGGRFFSPVHVNIALGKDSLISFSTKWFNKVHSRPTPRCKLRQTFEGITKGRGGRKLLLLVRETGNFANLGSTFLLKTGQKSTEKRNGLLGSRMANYANALHQILAPSEFLSSFHWSVHLC